LHPKEKFGCEDNPNSKGNANSKWLESKKLQHLLFLFAPLDDFTKTW
jgi:hypothetical protein